MNPFYPRVAERAGHRCEYCRAPEVIFNFPLEVEHVTARSRQGADDESNLALGCRACNVRKSDHLTGFDPATGTEVSLFNPREHTWAAHFEVDPERIGLQERSRIGQTLGIAMAPAQRLLRRKVVRMDRLPDEYKRLTLECGHTVCQIIHTKVPKTVVCYKCAPVAIESTKNRNQH